VRSGLCSIGFLGPAGNTGKSARFIGLDWNQGRKGMAQNGLILGKSLGVGGARVRCQGIMKSLHTHQSGFWFISRWRIHRYHNTFYSHFSDISCFSRKENTTDTLTHCLAL